MGVQLHGDEYLVSTMFLHYHYRDIIPGGRNLLGMTLASLPNGVLGDTYVPNAVDAIFVAGPDAPTLGEAFRTRLSFSRLHEKCRWRVQNIHVTHSPGQPPAITGEWME